MRSDAWRDDVGTIEEYRDVGTRAIEKGGAETQPLPWNFSGTVFRCAWEYPVADFEAEVGFYVDALGFTPLAIDHEYALFATPGNDLTFACRRHGDGNGDYSGHILCFMTRDIGAFTTALEARVGSGAIQRLDGSPVQTVLRLLSPAGLQLDIWEFPS
jgi:catechol 2,3-dioxygenase-like lactoylglutathione lyase family enzyme